ncbi:TadE/TadG family type IV pilus assembly protein [Phenylobacterium terrae]|uniref:TadE/TadG family type IV pilus assembly protein n=1 Tax=Phenylobacterium terrae TaxID=2665495 RepID=A0ABW4N286_9CAUL
MRRLIRRLIGDRRGVAATEAALLAPVFLAIGFGCADAGGLLLERHRIKVGLALGARMLARAPVPSAMESTAKNIAVTGRPSGGASRVQGWTTNDLVVSYRFVANSGGAYVGGANIRIVRLETTKDYEGLGLLNFVGVGATTIRAWHEERWTG